MDTFIHLLDQYGYIILFLSLMLELIAFPIPTEPLMSYVGYLIYQHQMNLYLSIVVAALGSFCGMNVAYWIGFKLGYPFFNKHGAKLHLGNDRLKKLEGTFKRYGTKFLLITCFIPGVRHLAGYFAGISRMPFRSFSVFSGIGVLIWTATFISLGDILGPQWMLIEKSLKKYMVFTIAIIVVAGIVVFLVKKYLEQIKYLIVMAAKQIYSSYKIRFGQKLLITCVVIVFVAFVSLSIGLIQDYFGHDFGDFNRVFLIVFGDVFQESSRATTILIRIWNLSSPEILIGIVVVTAIIIAMKSPDRLLEIQCMGLLLIGGYIYIEGIRRLFAWLGHIFHWTIVGVPPFPNDRLIVAAMIYGFCAFILSRHTRRHSLKVFALIAVLVILVFLGLSGIYFNVQPPSGIVAGYIFASVWLSFVILVLEISRLIRWNIRQKW